MKCIKESKFHYMTIKPVKQMFKETEVSIDHCTPTEQMLAYKC